MGNNMKKSILLLFMSSVAGLGAAPASQPIPLTSPYAADIRTVTEIPSNAVDWVLVELRNTNEVPVFSKSLFLRTDGQVMNPDGSTNLVIEADPMLDYSIVIKHRNHATAMTPQPLAFTNIQVNYDFTPAHTQYFGGTNAAVEIDPGVWASRAGDVDGDGMVGAVDAALFSSQLGSNGYSRADVNLDGVVDSNDWNISQAAQGQVSTVPRPEVNLQPGGRITPPRQTLVEGEAISLVASELLRSEEGLCQESLQSPGTADDLLVLLGEFLQSQHGDNVL